MLPTEAVTVAGHTVQVRAKPGLPGPIYIARVGKWCANEHGRLFEIPARCEADLSWWW
ncbi:MAG: hypothetical protein ACAI25_16910 [Planctomycetota bacterium]